MGNTTTWLPAILTVAVLVLYEGALLLVQQRHPARLAHADLREEWLGALSKHPGSEVLAVQTLRNSLMAATMTASTAAPGLMGAVTLAAPLLISVNSTLGDPGAAYLTARLALELVLMTLVFSSLVCSAMAARYYNHAGSICAMPVNSPARQRWVPIGAVYLRRAGLLYS